MQIYIARDGQQTGPFSIEDVNQQLAAGKLSASDLAWYEGAAGWIPLSTVPGLSGTSSTPPVFPPPAGPVVPASTVAVVPDSMIYAGFWIRVLAYLIDGIILGIAGSILNGLFGGLSGESQNGTTVVPLLQLIFGFFYMAGLWASSIQATLGQKILGLKVVNAPDGAPLTFLQATGRYFALLLSFMMLCIGVIMVAFTERKQGLHDMLAHTYVVKTRA